VVVADGEVMSPRVVDDATAAGDRSGWYDAEGLNRGTRWPTRADGDADGEATVVTPVADFFRRNHAPPPHVDVNGWRLSIEGLVASPRRWTLPELVDAFPAVHVEATLVCAGLRRAEFGALGSLRGELPWGSDAASTGAWRGIRLRDVLDAAGVADGARFVESIGGDRVERHGETFGYGTSIALAKAREPDVLLATHLNEAPLTAAHGFPLRLVVPGWIGARSVKWVERIVLRADESPNYFQRRAYRVARTEQAGDPRDVSHGVVLDEVPRNAVVTSHADGAVVPAGPVRVRGWALGEGGRPVTRVEWSLDDGATWHDATPDAPPRPRTWTWWTATPTVPRGDHTLCVRAHDAEGTMPSQLAAGWNVKGYGNNAWYRVRLTAV
jgi:sulfite oxidase